MDASIGDRLENLLKVYNLKLLAYSSQYVLDLIDYNEGFYELNDFKNFYKNELKALISEGQSHKCYFCSERPVELLFEEWDLSSGDKGLLKLSNIFGVCRDCYMRNQSREVSRSSHPLMGAKLVFDPEYIRNYDERLYEIARDLLNRFFSLRSRGILFDEYGRVIVETVGDRETDVSLVLRKELKELFERTFENLDSDEAFEVNDKVLFEALAYARINLYELALNRLKRKVEAGEIDDTEENNLELTQIQILFKQLSSAFLNFLKGFYAERQMQLIFDADSALLELLNSFLNAEDNKIVLMNAERRGLFEGYWETFIDSEYAFRFLKRVSERKSSINCSTRVVVDNKEGGKQRTRIMVSNFISVENVLCAFNILKDCKYSTRIRFYADKLKKHGLESEPMVIR